MPESSAITVLYFAALAEELKCSEEQVTPPTHVATVSELKTWLSFRGPHWEALQRDSLLCAVNQEIVNLQHTIHPGDEVAFFPPVTGG